MHSSSNSPSPAGVEGDLPQGARPSLEYNRARCLELRGDAHHAKLGYHAVLSKCPDYVDCLLRLGYMELARSHKAEAEEFFKQAAQKPGGKEDATAILCMMCIRNRKWAPAQVRFASCVSAGCACTAVRSGAYMAQVLPGNRFFCLACMNAE